MARLAGKVALITGGTTGIGAATAARLREEEATVIVTGSNPATLDAARTDLPGVEVVASDAADVAAIRRLIDDIRQRHGRIDILFVNAGISRVAPIDEVDEALFDRIFGVNVRGAFFVMQQAQRIIPDGGTIILNSSVVASIGSPGFSVYSATKTALRSFARVFAAELAPRRIRVNVVSPGMIETPIFGKLGLSAEQSSGLSGHLASTIPLGRTGSAEEVAATVAFLASDDASFINGAEILVDGGQTGI